MIGTQCCGPAGSVVIYDETSAGNDHAAFSVGGGLICQHNPGRCRCVRCRLISCVCRGFACLAEFSRFRIVQHLGRLGHASRLLLRLLKSTPQKNPILSKCRANINIYLTVILRRADAGAAHSLSGYILAYQTLQINFLARNCAAFGSADGVRGWRHWHSLSALLRHLTGCGLFCW